MGICGGVIKRQGLHIKTVSKPVLEEIRWFSGVAAQEDVTLIKKR
jgi:hypothetical protein